MVQVTATSREKKNGFKYQYESQRGTVHVCTILLTIQYNNINSIYAHASQYCRGTYQVTACGYAGNLDLSVL